MALTWPELIATTGITGNLTAGKEPSFVKDSNDNFYIAVLNGSLDIYKSTDYCETFSLVRSITASYGGVSPQMGDFCISVNSVDDIIVTWIEKDLNPSPDRAVAYAQVYDEGTDTWGSTTLIISPAFFYEAPSVSPSIAADTDGVNVYVGMIFPKSSSPNGPLVFNYWNGSVWGTKRELNDIVTGNTDLAVSYSAGKLYYAYRRPNQPQYVDGANVTVSTGTFSTPAALKDGGASHVLTVSQYRKGTSDYLAYVDYDGSTNSIQKINVGGTDRNANTYAGSTARPIYFTPDSTGGDYVMYIDDDSGTPDIEIKTFDGTTYTAEETVTTPNGNVYYFCAVSAGYVAAYLDTTIKVLNGQAFPQVPEVTGGAVTDIFSAQADATGTVADDGDGTISERGFCYDTSANPTIADDTEVVAGTLGAFSGTVSSLSGGTTYYLRPYATNERGAAYGDEPVFKTQPTFLPIINIGG